MDVFIKQPNDVLDYDVDLSAWFADVPEDDIELVTLTLTSPMEAEPSLVAGPAPHPAYVLLGNNPKRFKLWLGGGTDRMEYKVTCLVRTEQDRTKEVDFKVKVRNQ